MIIITFFFIFFLDCRARILSQEISLFAFFVPGGSFFFDDRDSSIPSNGRSFMGTPSAGGRAAAQHFLFSLFPVDQACLPPSTRAGP